MPGFQFAYREGGGQPVREVYPLAKSMAGAGTPPAARLVSGDLVAYTTVAALTTSAAKVMRMLLAADKTANYEDGSTNRCGVYGIAEGAVATNSSGVAVAETSNGGFLPKVPSLASLNKLALNGHGQAVFIAATPDTVFKAKLKTAAASAVAYQALRGQLAGVDIAVSSGVSTYTVDSGESGEDLNLVIVDIDPRDTSYLTVFVKFRDEQNSAAASGDAETLVLGSYCQYRTGFPYTAQ